MKKLSVLYYFMFAVLVFFFDSCKPKHDHDQHGMEEMKHFYKVFNGKINYEDATRSNADLIFNYITFNDSIRKYFKNDNNIEAFKKDLTIKVYQYVKDPKSRMNFDEKVLGLDTLIVIINDTLTNNVEDPRNKSGKTSVGRGNMGCIPKFEKNATGNLFYFEEDGKRYLPLMRADHLMADKDSIIHYLTNYNFPISLENYKKIDSILTKNHQIEGGIDRESGDIFLRIYHQKDTLLSIKKM